MHELKKSFASSILQIFTAFMDTSFVLFSFDVVKCLLVEFLKDFFLE